SVVCARCAGWPCEALPVCLDAWSRSLPAVHLDTELTKYGLNFREIALDTALTRRAAVRCRHQQLSLMSEDVLPHRNMSIVNDPIATLSAKCRFIEPLAAASCV